MKIINKEVFDARRFYIELSWDSCLENGKRSSRSMNFRKL